MDSNVTSVSRDQMETRFNPRAGRCQASAPRQLRLPVHLLLLPLASFSLHCFTTKTSVAQTAERVKFCNQLRWTASLTQADMLLMPVAPSQGSVSDDVMRQPPSSLSTYGSVNHRGAQNNMQRCVLDISLRARGG